MRFFLRYWLLVVVYLLTVWGVSLFGSMPLAAKLARYDKIVHGAEYFLLALLVARALQAGWRRSRPLAALLSLVLVLVFAVLDEAIQRLNPARTAEVMDLVADAIGAVGGVGVYYLGLAVAERGRRNSQESTSPSTSSRR